MSVESRSARPIFASEENEYLTPHRPPISRLAVGSFVLGIISSIVLFNINLMAVPILAVALALGAYWQVARTDALRGKTLALLGLSMGLAFATWSLTSTRMRDQYLYKVGSQLALHFVDILSHDKQLEAFELMKVESERQVAGTSLEEHYRLADEVSRERLKAFQGETAVKRVVELGPQAKWQFKKGMAIAVVSNGAVQVNVRLMDASRTGGDEVDVGLQRAVHAGSASWHVTGVSAAQQR
jgi:hypothetical protein